MRKFLLLFLVVGISLILVACNPTSNTTTPVIESNTQSEENKPVEESNSDSEQPDQVNKLTDSINVAGYSPFTGRLMTNNYENRAVMASIENSPAARPQAGLQEAEIVYEYLVEGGITRFLALYWPQVPAKIGPIRSARPYLIETATEHQSVFLHAGASPAGFALLQNEEILHIDQIYKSEYFWRSSKRSAPHNLYTGRPALLDYLEQLSDHKYQDRFSFLNVGIITPEMERAEEITIDYWGNYNVAYRYDEQENLYKRFIYDFTQPHRNENGDQLTATNVLVKFAKTEVKDEVGRLEININGTGKAYLFRDGVLFKGTWSKKPGDWTSFFSEDGSEFALNPGRTWIQIVTENTKVDYREAD